MIYMLDVYEYFGYLLAYSLSGRPKLTIQQRQRIHNRIERPTET